MTEIKPDKRTARLAKKADDMIADLNAAIIEYEAKKSEMDALKKIVDQRNKEIKDIMEFAKVSEYQIGDIEVVRSISKRQDFIEDRLLEKLRPLKLRGLIKKREYVDMDLLESAIYHGKINAAELSDCQITKEVVSLRIRRVKSES